MTEKGSLYFEGELHEALRSIPEDLGEAIQMEPALFLTAASRLHGLMSHWASRMAYAKADHHMAKAAREAGTAQLEIYHRDLLNKYQEKVTEGQVSAKVKADSRWLDLNRAEALAEAEHLKLKGLVDAIVTKRESMRLIGYLIKPEIDLAAESFTTPEQAHRARRANAELDQVHEAMAGLATEEKSENSLVGQSPSGSVRVKVRRA